MRKYLSYMVAILLRASWIATQIYAAPPGGIKITDIIVQTKQNVSTVEIDGTLEMIARVMPANATIKTVFWSVSDNKVAMINPTSGVLTGIALGEVWVYASSVDGSNVKDSMKITVVKKSIKVTGIRIFSENGLYEVSVGNTLKLAADVEPDSATDTTLKWTSSNISLATVSQKGLVSALSAGEVWIRATANDGSGVVDSVKITIKEFIPVTSVTISGDTVIAVGTSAKFKADVQPDNATDSSVTWSSSNNLIATVSMSGLVTGVTEGYVWIKAVSKSNPSIGDSLKVHITKFIPVTAINITTNTGDTIVCITDTLQMIATVVPQDASKPSLTWTVSNASIASISNKGMLIGKAAGVVTVTATATDGSGVKGTINIKVIPKLVSLVEVLSPSDSVAVGVSMQMSARVIPVDATNKNVVWAVNNGSASIDASGLLTGIAKGKVLVTATAADGSGVMGSKEITVIQFVPVSGITISTATGSFKVGIGDTLQMLYSITPDSASVKKVTWSVNNPDIASINENGQLTGKSIGTVTVTAHATDGSGVTASVNVDVVIIPATSIVVESDHDTVYVSLTIQMNAIVLPAEATDKSVVWTVSNTAVAQIDPYTGLLTGVAPGDVDVIATAKDGSGITGMKKIKVLNYVPVSSIAVTGLNNDSIVSAGNTLQMVAIIKPDNASIKSVTWKVSNSLVATISSSGLLLGRNPGKVLVTATADDGTGISGSTIIEVVFKLVQSITVSAQTGITSIKEKDSVQMMVQILPEDASYKEVEWSVSDTGIAYISTTGMLVAKKAGTVTVIAKAKDGSGISGSIVITVIKKTGIMENSPAVISIYPNPATDYINISGAEGKTVKIVDEYGRVILEREILTENELINLNGLSSGVFFIQINGDVRQSVLIIKQ